MVRKPVVLLCPDSLLSNLVQRTLFSPFPAALPNLFFMVSLTDDGVLLTVHAY